MTGNSTVMRNDWDKMGGHSHDFQHSMLCKSTTKLILLMSLQPAAASVKGKSTCLRKGHKKCCIVKCIKVFFFCRFMCSLLKKNANQHVLMITVVLQDLLLYSSLTTDVQQLFCHTPLIHVHIYSTCRNTFACKQHSERV